MGRKRWGAGRGWYWGTKRWWACFLLGILLATALKGLLYASDESRIYQTADSRRNLDELLSGQEEEAANRLHVTGEADAGLRDNSKDKYGSGSTTRHTKQGVEGKSGEEKQEGAGENEQYERLRISVYLVKEKRIETMPIELYVRGVIAGEMPVEFELEALKAQAIAARTYIYRRLMSGERSGMNGIKADVTNTIQHQVYIPIDELLARWEGKQKEANLAKLNKAVEETKGQIVTYAGEPIEAAFFSTSNGYTENAADYWSMDVPYLQSVASPWDKLISPRYKEITTMKLSALAEKLGVKTNAVKSMRVLEVTEGKRIKMVTVGGKRLSGREVREKLGLASSQFSWEIAGDEATITTYGYGHGVGMSQWGANGMAKEGNTAQQILAHYYSGTKLEKAPQIPAS